jgi:hypothetical protein
MKRNLGKAGKAVRLSGGIAILALGIYYQNWLGLLGIVLIILALSGWCPIYMLLGMDHCPVKEDESD